eukprot:s1408_g9.t2
MEQLDEAPCEAGRLRFWVTLLSGEKACVVAQSSDTLRQLRDVAQRALGRPLLGFAPSDSPGEVPLPLDATIAELNLPQDSVLSALAGVQSTRFAFAACEGDGSVVSWGSPFAGGDTSEVEHELMDVQEVAANLMAFAAIRVDGSVVVWGHQSCGGQIDESLQAKLSENGGVRRIVTTDRAFAALKRDGSVVSWGCMYPSAQTPDLGTRRISSIYATRAAFAAVDAGGGVVAWGHAACGGDCTAVAQHLQEGVTRVYSTDNAFAALRRDGAVVTWGSQTAGGNSDAVHDLLQQGVQKVVATEAAFAALRADRSVVAWGDHLAGGTLEAPLQDVADLCSSGSAFAALQMDGTVRTIARLSRFQSTDTIDLSI